MASPRGAAPHQLNSKRHLGRGGGGGGEGWEERGDVGGIQAKKTDMCPETAHKGVSLSTQQVGGICPQVGNAGCTSQASVG